MMTLAELAEAADVLLGKPGYWLEDWGPLPYGLAEAWLESRDDRLVRLQIEAYENDMEFQV